MIRKIVPRLIPMTVFAAGLLFAAGGHASYFHGKALKQYYGCADAIERTWRQSPGRPRHGLIRIESGYFVHAGDRHTLLLNVAGDEPMRVTCNVTPTGHVRDVTLQPGRWVQAAEGATLAVRDGVR